jgi:hypothetical protein
MAGDPNARESDWVVTVDTVFPHHTNPLGTLFGGRVLELMERRLCTVGHMNFVAVEPTAHRTKVEPLQSIIGG